MKIRDEQIKLKNRISELEFLREYLEQLCTELSIPEGNRFQIQLAMEEIVSNIILYAFPKDEEHTFSVSIHAEDRILRFVLEDDGFPFDPTAVPDADVSLPEASRKIGGLGIFMTRQLMDRMSYRHEGRMNILTLEKRIEKEGER